MDRFYCLVANLSWHIFPLIGESFSYFFCFSHLAIKSCYKTFNMSWTLKSAISIKMKVCDILSLLSLILQNRMWGQLLIKEHTYLLITYIQKNNKLCVCVCVCIIHRLLPHLVLISCLAEYKMSQYDGAVVCCMVPLCHCEIKYIGHFMYAKRVTVGGFFPQ